MRQGTNRAQTIRGWRLICMVVNRCNKSSEENQENTNRCAGAVHASVGPQVEAKFHSSCLLSTMLIQSTHVACKLPKSDESEVTCPPTITAVPSLQGTPRAAFTLVNTYRGGLYIIWLSPAGTSRPQRAGSRKSRSEFAEAHKPPICSSSGYWRSETVVGSRDNMVRKVKMPLLAIFCCAIGTNQPPFCPISISAGVELGCASVPEVV